MWNSVGLFFLHSQYHDCWWFVDTSQWRQKSVGHCQRLGPNVWMEILQIYMEHIDCLVQDYSNSIANTLELL